mmetsp:Transcript_31117/g.76365  ORF Transcript_31117/g.76365 Transcript_31117/m.76365 type:complete len:651 (-) Transcript_31117:282-2234(-)|eukprot:CAMPEP_0206229658 /NCGR_PEP_ID=MMETSP0047_2-20121206/9820_1 /ASSEMBLY_ACC=CAM_ASM_000192 /TAXON_ID=195065 /ORGANISM="Chroomonas mesostigmatica_cf, Strain CCMP1168" /LENGTH=650 /DNA_ID=CAMNT_0053652983 /DNA_START=52 /DNA_END=2004 /DNA_ORIENTATION=+
MAASRAALVAAVFAALCCSAHGISCYSGQGIGAQYLYAPPAGLAELLSPANLVPQPALPFSGAVADCEASNATAGSTHCVTYTFGATVSWACSNPKVNPQTNTTLNNCSDGVLNGTGYSCCNATMGPCNVPNYGSAPVQGAASTLRCLQSPAPAGQGFRTGFPLHAALSLQTLNGLGVEATAVANGTTPTRFAPPTLTMGNPGVVSCGSDLVFKGARACVSMAWHNVFGTNVSIPIWGCARDHLVAMGISCGSGNSATGQTLSGQALVNAVFDESVSLYTRTQALAKVPPEIPVIPTFTDAQRATASANLRTFRGPDMITYDCCNTDGCNAPPAPSQTSCFMLNSGAVERASSLLGSNPPSALSALISTPQSCGSILGASDVCVTVTALGAPVFGGCYSDYLKGVGIPDLMGAGIRVECGAGGTGSGRFYVPPGFIQGLNNVLPDLNQIQFKCCKGSLCNTDAAPSPAVLLPGADATVEIDGFTSSEDFVTNGRAALEAAVAAIVSVGSTSVFTTGSCYGTATSSCLSYFAGGSAGGRRTYFDEGEDNLRRQSSSTLTAFLHVNSGGTATTNSLVTAMSAVDFNSRLGDRLRSSLSRSSIVVSVKDVAESTGGQLKAITLDSATASTLPSVALSLLSAMAMLCVSWLASF